jgi:hypothetical protein
LNGDVKICGSNFAKCIICESLKDLISKICKNSASAKKNEMKLWKDSSFIKNNVDVFITFGELNQYNPKKSIFISSMTRWTIP